MNFPDTVPGAQFHAESADRYNAVNALLRSHHCKNTSPQISPPHRLTVDVRNDSNDTLAAFTAISFTGAADPDTIDGILPGLSGIKAVNSTLPWGIATADIAPGEWGTAVICGVTHAVMDNVFTTAPGFRVVPAPTGLVPCHNHGAQVLIPARNNMPGVIMLDHISAGYTQDFTVSYLDPAANRFIIAAGETDFPGCKFIAETEITFPDMSISDTVFLVIKYERLSSGMATYTYEFRAATFINDNNCFTFELAKFNDDGALTQLWTWGKITMPGWVL